MLVAAREAIAGCACGGEDRRGCHRCLLRYARDAEFPLMSRHEALGMLDGLLDDWRWRPTDGTDEISLVDQVESELEVRFLTPCSTGVRPAASPIDQGDRPRRRPGRPSCGSPAGTRWRMRLQNTIRGTRPDVHFMRLDAEPPEVAVYLDGYRYHAAATSRANRNRLADDADKRARLRAHGYRVFAVTWDDVERWRGQDSRAGAVWPPYGGNAQAGRAGASTGRSPGATRPSWPH